jgi:NADPH-dependent glutamate synthase beta subunit-like oxidoreductase/Pyruvate/2-oxoacid:ferredoxin oxidoreductase delta subunit
MATSQDDTKLTFRLYKDGEYTWDSMGDQIFVQDTTHKCPVYVQRTPPCQGSCPSGEDIRGWLDIVRGIEKPTGDMSWQEYAFQRSTTANPFPSMMGRVCPAPCEDGCNRNDVDDFVGINAVEQFIGDTAFNQGFNFGEMPALSGKKIAIIGGGPAGMAAAYQLRKMGHASAIFDDHAELGGMMRYGIPGYRTPRDVLNHECQRIIDMGDIEVRTNTRVGKDVSVEEIEKEYDAILWAIGCKSGRGLFVDDWDKAENCISGVGFLEAFNEGRLNVVSQKVVCVGGGDTSIDVVSVARRLGAVKNMNDKDRPELVVRDWTVQDTIESAMKEGADVTLTSLFGRSEMTAAEHEVVDATTEGVDIITGVMPVGIVFNEAGDRAVGLKIADCTMEDNRPIPVEGTERVLDADLIVSAIGQSGDMTGIEDMDNGRGLIDSDSFYQVPGKQGHFVCGDIVRPHLLTTAIGQASIAAESIDHFLKSEDQEKRPKVDKHHFNLMAKLHEAGLDPEHYDSKGEQRGTSDEKYAVHNFEDRSKNEIIPSSRLFLGHFAHEARNKRTEDVPSAEEVIGHFHERLNALSEEETVAEANRCMSCGMCFECDNCVIYCPQDAVYRVKKDEATTGRYVATDYDRCIGCHICSDVCPTGYIDMAMGD